MRRVVKNGRRLGLRWQKVAGVSRRLEKHSGEDTQNSPLTTDLLVQVHQFCWRYNDVEWKYASENAKPTKGPSAVPEL